MKKSVGNKPFEKRFPKNKNFIIPLNLILAVVVVFELMIIGNGYNIGNAIKSIVPAKVTDVDSSQTKVISCIPAAEICDQKDNDCDKLVDEGGVCEVELTGTLETIVVDDFENNKADYLYYLNVDGKRYALSPIETIFPLPSRTKVIVRGLISGDKITLESNKDTSFKIVSTSPDLRLENIGPQRTLAIMLGATGLPPLANNSETNNMIFQQSQNTVQDYYVKNSYNKTYFTGNVVGPFIHSSNSLCNVDKFNFAIQSADPTIYFPNYDRIVILSPYESCYGSTVGMSSIGKTGINTSDGVINASYAHIFAFITGVIAHELGHGFGIAHSNYYTCKNIDDSLVSFSFDCTSVEYGDNYDVMGNSFQAYSLPAHFNALHKEQAGWLDEENSIVATNGTFLLKSLELSQQNGTIQQIKLPIDIETSLYAIKDNRFISIEFRQPIDYDSGFPINIYQGVLIHIGRVNNFSTTYSKTNLLSMHPEFLEQEQLGLGEIFMDEINGYKIRLDSITSSEAQVTVQQIHPLNINLDKPLLYYSFDNGTAIDMAGYVKNNGIHYGPIIPMEGGTYLDGGHGIGLRLPFTNEFIKNNNEFTISAWVKIENLSLFSTLPIFDNIIRLTPEGNINVGFDSEDGERFDVYSNQSLSVQKWYHIAGVYNGSELSVYTDGIKKGNVVVVDGRINPYFYSELGGSRSPKFSGIIDEFKIYANGLNSSEIVKLVEIGREKFDVEFAPIHDAFIDSNGIVDSTNQILTAGYFADDSEKRIYFKFDQTNIDTSFLDSAKLYLTKTGSAGGSSQSPALYILNNDYGILGLEDWNPSKTSLGNIGDGPNYEINVLPYLKKGINSFMIKISGNRRWYFGSYENVNLSLRPKLEVISSKRPYVCGDANSDTAVDISDAVFLIQHIFAGGPAPNPLLAGDANGDGAVDISDAVYLIQYIFAGGPEPCNPAPGYSPEGYDSWTEKQVNDYLIGKQKEAASSNVNAE
ncbi:MAG: LamG-like jellyroll fold domain-containing protein [Nanoarchaeota archaeon]